MNRPAKQVMPELQKIRHFVMNIIYQSEGKKVKLPSLRTLSAEFGLGASTIKQEFDRLEREGYLVSRHGVGVFTNPKQYFFPETKLPLVGIKLYQGDAYFYDATLMKMIAELMSALSAFPCNVHMLTAGCTTVEELDVELRHSHIDALVTVSVEPELTAFAASRMPAVNIGYPCPETDSVVFRGEAAGRELAELLCGARRSPRVLQLNDSRNIDGFRQALENDGRIRCSGSSGSVPAGELEPLLRGGDHDCVITHSKNIAFIHKFFGRNRPDAIPRLVAIDDGIYPDFPDCFYLAMPRQEAARLAAARLAELLGCGEARPPFERILEHKLCRHHSQS